MKTGAKVLCIIALVIGLIWATVGFFGSWAGGAVSFGVNALASDSGGAASSLNKAANSMLGHIGSFIVVILGGVLGIVGSANKPAKVKLVFLGLSTFICGCILFPLHNYAAAVLYIIAGLLLLLTGKGTQEETKTSEE